MEAILRSLQNYTFNFSADITHLIDEHPVLSFVVAFALVPICMILAVTVLSSCIILPMIWIAGL